MRPWDARLARFLVRPLRGTPVHPNHLTTLRLLSGVASAVAFALGYSGWGGTLFVASSLIDHTDGELARMTGKTSAFGHRYDLVCDAIVMVAVFIGIGLGLRESVLGAWAPLLGLLAGVSVAPIFWDRDVLAAQVGKKDAALPSWGGFEVEDIVYLLGPVAWFGALVPVLVASAIGAPLFLLWVLRHNRVVAHAARAPRPGVER